MKATSVVCLVLLVASLVGHIDARRQKHHERLFTTQEELDTLTETHTLLLQEAEQLQSVEHLMDLPLSDGFVGCSLIADMELGTPDEPLPKVETVQKVMVFPTLANRTNATTSSTSTSTSSATNSSASGTSTTSTTSTTSSATTSSSAPAASTSSSASSSSSSSSSSSAASSSSAPAPAPTAVVTLNTTSSEGVTAVATGATKPALLEEQEDPLKLHKTRCNLCVLWLKEARVYVARSVIGSKVPRQAALDALRASKNFFCTNQGTFEERQGAYSTCCRTLASLHRDFSTRIAGQMSRPNYDPISICNVIGSC